MTTLAHALVEAQKEMPPVKADKTADTGKYKYGYVTLDHLIAKTRPVLNRHGLAISQFPAVSDTGQPVLRTVILHAESGETLQAETLLLLGEKTMQQLGSAITYARRYAWAAALGISADEDDDGTLASQVGADGKEAPWAAADRAASGPAAASQAPGGAARPPTPPGEAAAPMPGEFRFASGKHQGKTLGEAPRAYLDWYLENGPKEDVKQAIRVFVGLTEPVTLEDDLDVPF